MSCKNCFNGCASTTSDKCVKYTGVSIPALGIDNGDSLAVVQDSILQNLLTVMDGTGIVIKVPTEVLCSMISNFLPTSGDITIDQYISALIESVCFLNLNITALESKVNVIEADYTIDCLPGVAPADGTHAILQATITFLCSLSATVTALSSNLSTNYTLTSDLPALIQSLLADEPDSTLLKNKMVPMTVVEYYGSVGNFDGSGAGIGDYVDIYLCNGANGTPDKRGRVGVGATTGMGGGAFAPAVDPGVAGNPAYTLLGAGGANTVALSIAQLPSHNHTATVLGAGAHNHTYDYYIRGQSVGTGGSGTRVVQESTTEANTSTVVDHTHTATIAATGDGESHDNIQPVLACYYIMYIP